MLSWIKDRTLVDLKRFCRYEYGMMWIPRDSMNWWLSVCHLSTYDLRFFSGRTSKVLG